MPGLHNDPNVPVAPSPRRPGGPFATMTGYGIAEPQWGFHEPRPINWGASPYARVPLPPASAPIDVHPILRVSDAPRLRWFIDQPAEEAQPVPSSKGPLPALWQTMPAFPTATDPSATIIIHIHPFRHPLIVRPYGLTIGGLLREVHRTLREEATREEYRVHNVAYTSQFHSSLLESWQQSTAPPIPPPSRDDQVSVNVRRLMDFKTLFRGLLPSPHEPDVWLLHTSGGLLTG